VIAVGQGDAGLVLAPGAEDVDAALGGDLVPTLTALGATGKAEEITRAVSGGKLRAPLIAAVGIGTASAVNPDSADAEVLRRAAGAAVRSLASPKVRTIALALPTADSASAEATCLGALLGSYYFGRYRSNGHPAAELTLIAGDDVAGAIAKAEVLASAVALVRDLVNTSPSHLFPESFASEAGQIAAAAGLDIEVSTTSRAGRRRLRRASLASARARCTRLGWSGSATTIQTRRGLWSSLARASRSIQAASR
jgi:leucyl aminopeptidase